PQPRWHQSWPADERVQRHLFRQSSLYRRAHARWTGEVSAGRDHRVLVFAPIGRDGPASVELFKSSNLEAVVCKNLPLMVAEMNAGVGAVVLAEEGIYGQDTAALADWIARQPPWSDLPFIILTSHRERPAIVTWRRSIVGLLRNVSLVERPVQPMTLASA